MLIKPFLHRLMLCCLFSVSMTAKAQQKIAINCTTGGFQKLIGGKGDDNALDVKVSIGGQGYIIAGSTSSAGTGGTDALLTGTDTSGAVLWSKTYGSSGDDAFNNIILTRDGNYAVVGWCHFIPSHVSDIFVAKIDPNGNLLWSRSYGAGTTYGEYGHMITETDDGGFAVAADYNTSAPVVQPLYMKLDANGSLLWSSLLNVATSGQAYGIVAQGDMLTGTGVVAKGGFSTFNDGYLVKLRSSDGSLVWTKNIESEGRSNRLEYIRLKNNQYLLDMYNTDNWVTGNIKPLVFTTDTSGNLLYSESYEIAGIQNAPSITRDVSPTADGGYIATISEAQSNTTPRLAKITNTGTIDWVDNFTPYYSQQMHRCMEDAQGNFLAIGQVIQSSGSNADILFIKANAKGDPPDNSVGCQLTHSTATNNNVPILITDGGSNYWTSVSNGSIAGLSPAVVVAGFSPAIKTPCDGTVSCTTLLLKGKDTLCSLPDIVSYTAVRSPGCSFPVQWSIDPLFATILSATDSTVQVQFMSNGTAKLYGKIISTCSILQDSLSIQALPAIPVHLGNDTAFCQGGSLVMDAGPGFQSYLWNTGAVSESITVTRQGTYSVAAANVNRCTSRDTLILTVFNLPTPQLGPDTILCRGNVYVFDAGNQFIHYLWQDSSVNHSFTATQPGQYWVQVEDKNHCFNADTAYISAVKELPEGFLLPSASICIDDYLQLKAIGNWASYLWSDNDKTDTTTITAPGQFWLEVTDTYGCSARDSITVTAKNCPRDIFFPNAFSPNQDGHNDIFKPTVWGALSGFHMAIFNRWGEKVFETNDASKGWDGSYKGKKQGDNTFVWYAVYQFAGRTQKEKTEKGTVLLVY